MAAVGWLEARARHASETTSKVRAAEALEHTFEPILATRKKKSDAAARKPPEQTCSSAVAHASHVRRYAAARDEKARASAALTWSTSSHRKVAPPPPPPTSLARQPPDGSVAGTPSRLASPQRSASPRPEDVCDDDDGDVDADDESFFAQLQRERARWDKEQAKLLTVIELQQRELHSRGLKAEERARSIATQFSDSISLFEARLIKMERDADGELASIRTLAEKILAAAEKPPDRNAAAATARRFDTLEVELRNLSQKLDALRTT